MSSPATPQITFPEELPVSAMRDTIARAVAAHQVVIVAGETGSGKTTQLPKIMLQLGRKAIVHTQPRRIAARAVAERIAEELGTDLGELVGYQVRFTDTSSKATKIKLVTDGILLNAIHHDRLLKSYDTVIIDEAHERSLNIDFLLGYLRTILPRRPDLKVIITSATIDPASFASHFADRHGNPAPVIEVTGRSYPVEIRYRSLLPETPEQPPLDVYEALCLSAAELLIDTPGDILAFFAGEGEIKDAKEALQGYFQTHKNRIPQGKTLEILPLYGRLSAAEQHRVFSRTPADKRRIVLATNVAETSLTVPNITGVIDTGTARISRYSSRSKVQRLPIEAIAQANATQRAGRAGRLAPGVAIRLYSEADFNRRPLFTDPEILRTGLASVLLQMYALELGDVKKFPFLTPPDQRGVRDGIALLTELHAINNGRLTAIGHSLARIPLEPRFARMLIEGLRYDLTERMIALVAGLTIADVREYPEAEREQAAALHNRFKDPLGDLHSLLNLYDYLRKTQQELGSSAFRRQLKSEYLNVLRIREWFDLVSQLQRSVRDLRLPERLLRRDAQAPTTAAELISYCALAGLLSHLGVRDERSTAAAKFAALQKRGSKRRAVTEYLGSRGVRFALHPSSALASKPPETVMSVELVETRRLFARGNTAVNAAWAEALAGKLAKTSFSEPHWSKKHGAAMCYERVTLYGVPLVAGRLAPLRRYDAALARQLFIREALVAENWNQDYPFLRHNAQLRRKLQNLEEQTRKRGLIGGDEEVYAFYSERLPQQVCSSTDFAAWWRSAGKKQPKLLNLRESDLLESTAQQELDHDASQYPRVWSFGEQQLQLRYRFDPTAADDGVTVVVPLPLLPQLRAEQFTQLVPGMRHELVAALLKTLPKHIRKHVVPANEWATTLLREIEPELPDTAAASAAGGSTSPTSNSEHKAELQTLLPLLANAVKRHASLPVLPQDFDLSRLPGHLLPTFRVVDTRGRVIASGKELEQLQRDQAHRSTASVANKTTQQLPPQQHLERSGLTAWPNSSSAATEPLTIPRQLSAKLQPGRGYASSGTVKAFPALIDRGKTVDLKLFTTAAAARQQHPYGVARLLTLTTAPLHSYIKDHLSQREKLQLAYSPYRTLDDLISDLALAVAHSCAAEISPDGLIYEPAEFAQAQQLFERRMFAESFNLMEQLATLCETAREASKAITAAKSLTVLPLVADATEQLRNLCYASAKGKGFISEVGIARLPRIRVYLQALIQRMQQLPHSAGRDSAALHTLQTLTSDYLASGGTLPLTSAVAPELQEVRWLLEELRVSLYAQQLGTAGKVSPERVKKALAALPKTP
ncbi:ATP-dependent RNA helicase HrpA [Canibacter oris]|uniref:ATP-dependent helicase HrpA n=1 Tax=Canibacter oris TaxID=1365628 RepID=A0A840DDA0_9MICO|nr:ATP-dependent RNA helicase HrpA [Canibacter oris]MBB4071024.1 ATP-dependent helicase HrpA [Canibacter oris]